MHSRTLNRYLNELLEFDRIRITAGNKHKGGYKYQFTDYTTDQNIGQTLTKWMETTLEAINKKHNEPTKKKGGKGSQST